ncbi:MAG: GDSL-type esterase/lipase family protein [Propionibacterium sp.]|nr:GDSL-type esterase/lipase family protein [Propionibacterium sp.]
MRPKGFLKRGRRPGTRSLVVCAGDSITHGLMSADYVRMLQQGLGDRGYEFVNAGWSGDLAYNLWARLDEIIACQPDVVTILIGTNDAAAQISDEWMRGYQRDQKPLEPLTLDYYRRMLTGIVDRLLTQTEADIALLELPLLSEDPTNQVNQLVDDYNDVIHEVADEADVPVLLLREAMVKALPPGHPAPWFDGSKKLMGSAFARHLVLRQAWNTISDRYGLFLLTDQIHLNDRAARLIADEISRHLAGIDH